MKPLSQSYYDLSSRLLERSASVRVIGSKHGGTAPSFRKHYKAVLEIILDLQAHVDLAQEVIGDQEFVKHIATLAMTVAQVKAIANGRIAANTITPDEGLS